MMKRIMNGPLNRLAMASAVILTAGWASAATFTGADPGDNLFSTTNNWVAFPTASENFGSPWAAATSIGNPGQLDAAFNALLPSGFGNSFINGDNTGTVYLEVLPGAVWRSSNLTLGHQNTGVVNRHGVISFKSGSSLIPAAGNGSTLTIGGEAGKSRGRLEAEDGMVVFSYAQLTIKAEGTLAFQFGTNSVSSFVSTKNTGAATMLLDGAVEVDLGALEQTGTYPLITVSHTNSLLSGGLITWLDSQGGTVSGTGNLNTNNFKVINSPGVKWSLTAASKTNLMLTVTGFDPISERSLPAVQDVGVRATGSNNREDTGKAGAILLHDSSTRGLFEFDLSTADYKITNAVLKLTQLQNQTGGSWEMSIYPLVYTTNNYSWFEGNGVDLYTSNLNSPATADNAACYLYSRDDVSSPVQWEDGSGASIANIAQTAVWNSAIATIGGTNSVAGNQIVFNLDAAELEKMRTNGVGRISFGIWGTESLTGNYLIATKDNDNMDYHPVLDIQMKTPLQDPVITGINVEKIAAGNRVEVSFEKVATASLAFSPNLTPPAWSNVAFGPSPLLHTNNVSPGFYKVTASE